jgi:hypothetical protein
MKPSSLLAVKHAAFCASAAAFAASAQDMPPRFELTPYAGYRFGGEFEPSTGSEAFELREGSSRGLMLDIRAKDVGTQWEIVYAHQQTELETQPAFGGGPLLDVAADYLHFGGTYLFDGQATRPFVALTAGVTHFEPAVSALETENYFSASLGGGVHLRADKRVGVRLEGRVFATLVNDDGALFCAAGGTTNACAIVVDGDTLFQWEARAGLVVRF